eukprot:8355230-Alexandrium_andersonii.AAC.1
MSASLVGSEMCIRDSAPPPPFCSAVAALPRWPPPALPGGGPAMDSGRAVSYTHLTLPTICSV